MRPLLSFRGHRLLIQKKLPTSATGHGNATAVCRVSDFWTSGKRVCSPNPRDSDFP